MRNYLLFLVLIGQLGFSFLEGGIFSRRRGYEYPRYAPGYAEPSDEEETTRYYSRGYERPRRTHGPARRGYEYPRYIDEEEERDLEAEYYAKGYERYRGGRRHPRYRGHPSHEGKEETSEYAY